MVALIKQLCKEKRMSLNELESSIGLGTNTIYKWDRAMPSADKLERVADFFDVSVDYLLGREEDAEEHEDDVTAYREMLHKDKRYGILLSASKKLTTKDLDAVIHIVESMGGDEY